jgi:nucleoside-diphosphate-sugar epimerase
MGKSNGNKPIVESADHSIVSELIKSETQLDEFLAQTSDALIGFIKQLDSPLVILGAGGKMGPTLAMMARRTAMAANPDLEVIAVSRFSDPTVRQKLEEAGVRTICHDLLDPSLDALPNAPNVIYMAGMKFGTQQNPSLTWAMNTLAPAAACRRYRGSRMVILSTGNVYPMSEVSGGGSLESDPLTPLGEYSNAAVARERICEYFAAQSDTPMTFLRLFYAVEPRYGVLVDIGRKVHAKQPIQLATGYFNCIWQRDANDMILRSLALASSPRTVWNLCRPEIISVRQVADQFGGYFGWDPVFEGHESSTALLGNSSRLCKVLGEPPTMISTMIAWLSEWIQSGGRLLDKPTRFEVRDGAY